MGGLVPVQEGAIMFDSHHFANSGGALTVTCRVTVQTIPGGSPVIYTNTYSAPAKNKAAIFNTYDVESAFGGDSALTTSFQLNSINYANSMTAYSGWTASTFQSRLGEDVNVVAYDGHGSSLNIRDGVLPPGNGKIWAMTADGTPSIQQMREAAIPNSPWPPFNTPANPSFNLFTNLSCCTTSGSVSNFLVTLYPMWNGYGKLLEDQAYMGFNVTTLIGESRAMATHLYGKLKVGDTIASATAFMIAQPDVTDYTYQILGDGEARLKRVYYPGNNASLFWRPILMP
jgi:hypothetical protein